MVEKADTDPAEIWESQDTEVVSLGPRGAYAKYQRHDI